MFVENHVQSWSQPLSDYGNFVASLGITQHIRHHEAVLEVTECADLLKIYRDLAGSEVCEVTYSHL